MMRSNFAIPALVIAVGWATALCARQDLPERVGFNEHIRPIMSNTCFACHGPDDSANHSGLRLDSFAASVDSSGAIVPGDPEESLVVERILDRDDPMPPKDFRHQLSSHEKALIAKWIRQGANYETHWSYAPITKPELPSIEKHASGIANPIDAFVLGKLQSTGIQPSPLADKRTLLRRLSLDLTGLPPAPDELANFLSDESAGAYEKQVDRLLASPHYGERMASSWLDIVRFSDTVGFHGDQNQHIFPYRDYVIASLNDNQRFDEFTIEQLAGDLVDQPREKQLIATGLIRLNMMTREGGAQPEEYLAKYAADRVRMIGTAWLGSTLSCCECHDHKYDPFSTKDFYSLAAFFDDVRQWGVYSNYGYTPNKDLLGFTNDHPFPPEMRIESPSLQKQIEFLEHQLDEAAAEAVQDDSRNSPEFKRWLDSTVSSYAANTSLWTPVHPQKIVTMKKEPYEKLDDGSILLTKKPGSGQTMTLTSRFDKPTMIKAVRMQVLPDKSNGGKVGRSNGKFTSDLEVIHLPNLEPGSETIDVKPRYIRIELPGGNKILSLAEVQVFGQNKKLNFALEGKVTQSSVDHNGPPELAIDDNTQGDHGKQPGVSHTKTERDPWWELDLLKAKRIEKIVIWNRTDGGLGKRLNGYRLSLLDEDRNLIFQATPRLPKPSININIPEQVSAASLMQAEKIAYAQADRYTPTRYSSGKANKYLGNKWQSGPARWQLPDNESELEHNAIYHLNTPIHVQPGESIAINIKSSDVGRFRLYVSSVTRPVVDPSACNNALASALAALTVTSKESGALTDSNWVAIESAYYRSTVPENKQLDSVRKLRDDIASCYSGFAMTMISQLAEGKQRRQSRVLPRGDWKDDSGEVVNPATPSFLPGHSSSTDLNRLDLANWIVSENNPLTARHFVNRTWKHFFGKGLSNVLDDLGNQGEWPSHPRLLDWLASEFKSDWDRKKLVRLIVTSNTYRQQAGVRPELFDKDPGNRLLAQQSPRRLEAEIVRDNALAISGLLNTDWIGGRSVYPFQPPGYYSNLQFPNRRYGTENNGLQYRRGVYMHWQRTFLHPMLTNFDAPSRDECAADRIESNSPQQALTLLNDPVFVEAATAFALRVNEGKTSVAEAIEEAFEIALARNPEADELSGLTGLYKNQLAYFESHPEDAEKFVRIRETGLTDQPAQQIAALSQVCRVILNLHEVITRY